MKLKKCLCCHCGTIIDNTSFCEAEGCYSYLSECIRKQALREYCEAYSIEPVRMSSFKFKGMQHNLRLANRGEGKTSKRVSADSVSVQTSESGQKNQPEKSDKV